MTPDQSFDLTAPANGNGSVNQEDSGEGRFPPGRAWFVADGNPESDAVLVACQERSRIDALLGHVEFNLRARAITVVIDEIAVPVVVVMLRIAGEGETALFSAWINELSPRTGGVLESLATQAQLRIVLVDEMGRTAGSTLARNVLVQRMEGTHGWISNLARTSPWTRHQFSAAKAHIRSQHPTNEDLWRQFDEDSSSEMKELTAVPA